MKWTHWLNALIGIWFIISPWTLNYSGYTAALWLSIIGGAIQLIVSVWAALTDTSGWGSWQSWVEIAMGVWFIIETMIWSFSAGAIWTNVILGAVTIIVALIYMGSTQGRSSSSSQQARS